MPIGIADSLLAYILAEANSDKGHRVLDTTLEDIAEAAEEGIYFSSETNKWTYMSSFEIELRDFFSGCSCGLIWSAARKCQSISLKAVENALNETNYRNYNPHPKALTDLPIIESVSYFVDNKGQVNTWKEVKIINTENIPGDFSIDYLKIIAFKISKLRHLTIPPKPLNNTNTSAVQQQQ